MGFKDRIKEIKTKLDELDDKINLSKLYPNYFNKGIIRATWVLIFIVMFSIFASEGFIFHHYWIENPNNFTIENPYRTCGKAPGLVAHYSFDLNAPSCFVEPPPKLVEVCGGDCPDKLEPNQIIGHKPNIFYRYSTLIFFLILAWGFLINHVRYLELERRINLK